jgi:hypothetical protein
LRGVGIENDLHGRDAIVRNHERLVKSDALERTRIDSERFARSEENLRHLCRAGHDGDAADLMISVRGALPGEPRFEHRGAQSGDVYAAAEARMIAGAFLDTDRSAAFGP